MKDKIIVNHENEPTPVLIDEFLGLVKGGMELWADAGAILVELVEKNPMVYSEIISANPSITFEMLVAFERMGRHQIYPPLLMDGSLGAKRLIDMPYETQEKFCKEPMAVVIDASNGDPVVSMKHVKELNAYETKMVFDTDKIRTVPEQAEFAKTHNRQGRKPRQKNSKIIGTFTIKMSPSGGMVIEKSDSKTMCPKLVLYEKGGIKQCAVNISMP